MPPAHGIGERDAERALDAGARGFGNVERDRFVEDHRDAVERRRRRLLLAAALLLIELVENFRRARHREIGRPFVGHQKPPPPGPTPPCARAITKNKPKSVARYHTLTRRRASNPMAAARGSTRPRNAAIMLGNPRMPMIPTKSSGRWKKNAKA